VVPCLEIVGKERLCTNSVQVLYAALNRPSFFVSHNLISLSFVFFVGVRDRLAGEMELDWAVGIGPPLVASKSQVL
jgi:hypothetical protein